MDCAGGQGGRLTLKRWRLAGRLAAIMADEKTDVWTFWRDYAKLPWLQTEHRAKRYVVAAAAVFGLIVVLVIDAAKGLTDLRWKVIGAALSLSFVSTFVAIDMFFRGASAANELIDRRQRRKSVIAECLKGGNELKHRRIREPQKEQDADHAQLQRDFGAWRLQTEERLRNELDEYAAQRFAVAAAVPLNDVERRRFGGDRHNADVRSRMLGHIEALIKIAES